VYDDGDRPVEPFLPLSQAPEVKPMLTNCRCGQFFFLAAVFLGVAALIATPPATHAEDPGTTNAKALSRAFRGAAEAASPAVVTIIAKSKSKPVEVPPGLRELLKDPRFKDLVPGAPPPKEKPKGKARPGEEEEPEFESQIGSGVLIDTAGVILTNNHVVEEAEDILVRLHDGREYQATSPKGDTLSDLAILHIKAEGPLPAARLGDSDKLETGDWVIAIGSPFELDTTVSAGIISGKGRGIHQIQRGKLLQTDAAINPGNSGGPLVNLDGEVVGINTAIATSTGGYQGIGFAIPINRAKWVVRELVKTGSVRRAYLGIRIDETTSQVAKRVGVPVRSGVLVIDVIPNSPSADAGLKANDVIVEFAGERVRDPRDLQDAVEQKPLDSRQQVKVLRGGKTSTLELVVKPLPEGRK
jgi:serine protease Do